MSIRQSYKTILNELQKATLSIDERDFNKFAEILVNSWHIYVTGKGRSGLAALAFANRLLHLGFSVSIIGEITSPHTSANDCLIVVSGSGETETLISVVKKAHEQNLTVVLLTMNKKSKMSQMSDLVINIPGASPKVSKEVEVQSIQPMGSLFEQTTFLLLDAFVLEMMKKLNIEEDAMYANHADIE